MQHNLQSEKDILKRGVVDVHKLAFSPGSPTPISVTLFRDGLDSISGSFMLTEPISLRAIAASLSSAFTTTDEFLTVESVSVRTSGTVYYNEGFNVQANALTTAPNSHSPILPRDRDVFGITSEIVPTPGTPPSAIPYIVRVTATNTLAVAGPCRIVYIRVHCSTAGTVNFFDNVSSGVAALNELGTTWYAIGTTTVGLEPNGKICQNGLFITYATFVGQVEIGIVKI